MSPTARRSRWAMSADAKRRLKAKSSGLTHEATVCPASPVGQSTRRNSTRRWASITWLYPSENKTPKEFGSLSPKVWVLKWAAYHRLRISTRRPGWRYTDFGCIHRYDLPSPRRNALSQPQVWLVFSGQTGELRLWDDSSVHRFACAVVAGASIAVLRGES